MYEYNVNNLLLSITYQDWHSDSLDWQNVWRETYTYTPQNKIATMLKETWTPELGWNNYMLQTYFYDTNNNWTERIIAPLEWIKLEKSLRHLATWLEPVGVQKEQLSSNSFYLHNNYPNPFNPYTKIKYFIPALSFVTIKVFDLLGKEVATLVNEEKAAGEYEIEFDGKGLSSGMYYYKLTVNDFSQTKKMILLR